MNVPDAAAFLTDVVAQTAVKEGLAALLSGILSSWITLVVTAARRLEGVLLMNDGRRMAAAGAVKVAYTISIPAKSAATATAQATALTGLTAAAVTTSIKAKLVAAKGSAYNSMAVTAKSAVKAKAPAVLKIAIWQPICTSTAATCGWPAGNSMNVSAYLMVERINKANILGGYMLQLDVKDTQCSASQGKTKADSLVAMAKSAWPFAVIGCGCSGCTTSAAPILSSNRVPQVSQSASSVALSDRTKYPHFFRTYPSDGPAIKVWLTIFKTWGLTRFAMVYDTAWGDGFVSYFKTTITEFNAANALGKDGVTMTDVFSGTTLGKMSAASASEAQKVIENMAVKRKQGVIGGIMMMSYANALRHLVCGLSKRTTQDLSGLAFSHFGSFSATWWTDDLSQLSGCDKSTMDKSTNLFIQATPQTWGTGSQKLGCDPSYTVGEFKAEYTARRTALGFKQRSTEVGTTADAICALAMAFKAMLDAGHTTSDLLGTQMNASTFAAVNSKIQSASFAGVSGPISFPTGSKASQYGGGDRLAIFEVFQKISNSYKMLGTFDVSADRAQIQFAANSKLQPPPAATVTPDKVIGALFLVMSEADASTMTAKGPGAQKIKDALAKSLAASLPKSLLLNKDMIDIEIWATAKGSRRRLEGMLRQLVGSVKVKVLYRIRLPAGVTTSTVIASVVAMPLSSFVSQVNINLKAAGVVVAVKSVDPLIAPRVQGANIQAKESDDSSLPIAVEIIVAIAAGIVFVLICLVIVLCKCRRKPSKAADGSQGQPSIPKEEKPAAPEDAASKISPSAGDAAKEAAAPEEAPAPAAAPEEKASPGPEEPAVVEETNDAANESPPVVQESSPLPASESAVEPGIEESPSPPDTEVVGAFPDNQQSGLLLIAQDAPIIAYDSPPNMENMFETPRLNKGPCGCSCVG